ncbi:MAG: ribosome biogenesis GTPase Der [Caldilineaceae bacterium]
MAPRKPVVALVGRPNVGKSTLFNKLTGKRKAIVEDLPGTTRDRIYGDSYWNGVGFLVVDTGGLEGADSERPNRPILPLSVESSRFVIHIRNQVQVAVDEADAIIFVVDGREGLTAADMDVADLLRASGKPIFVAANKAEAESSKLNAVEFWNLALGEPIAISAYHGDGVGDLLDELVKALPAFPDEEVDETEIGIAIVGRPNVGKSSLLNALLGRERAIVSEVPGTTRDSIDTGLTYEGKTITLIDTAGIRRRGSVEPGIEKYSVLRSMQAIDRADVALLLIDAVEGVTAQDAHVAGYVLEKMKGVIVVVNKWDAIEKDEHTMNTFIEQVRDELKFLSYVPVLFVSALTKQRIHRIMPTVLEVADARRHRMSTADFNNLLRVAYDAITPPNKHGRPLRVYYGTQVSVSPPTFAVFVNDIEIVHFSYQRYLENRIREAYPFVGTPIRLLFRAREQERER